MDLYEPIAEAKCIDLVFSEAQANSTRDDADLLFEAVSNLLDNAIRLHGFGLAQRQAERGCCIELQCWPHEPLSTLRSSLS